MQEIDGGPMATNRVPRKWSFEEYLAYEIESEIKHEYIDGEIYAMAGSTENHSLIMMNTTTEINLQLRDTLCRLHSSKMKIKISETKYVYPDFSAVCSKPIFDDDKHMILTNPVLVAEILSPSTEKYDRGLKSTFYRNLPTLKQYLIIEQSRIHIELLTRQEGGWFVQDFDQFDVAIPLDAIGVQLPVSEVYRGIEFNEDENW